MAQSDRPADEAQPPRSVADQLDEIFATWSRSDEPGMVVGVALEGRTIYRRGFGMASLESGAANTPATRMRIGSTSKHFTCLLALLLADEGKLDLDAPIRTYVQELTGPAGEPTLRQLLQHRGGSRCYLDLAMICHGLSMTPKGEALATLVRQTGRNFPPGEAMIYNNGGYHLVSIAIERVGGAPFERQLADRLFAPLGMSATASVPTDMEITPGIATMHIPLPGGGWRRGIFPTEEVRGEGAMVSSVDDMLRWMAHLRARDRFGSEQAWRELVEPPTYADGSKGIYALGLMLDAYRGLRTIHHAGGVIGGTAQMLTLPDDGLDVIVLANGAKGADVVRLAERIVDVVLADKVGPEPPMVDARARADLVGDWWSEETGMIYGLVDEEGALKLKAGPMTVPLRPAEGDRVVLPAGGIGEIAILPARPGGDAIQIRFGQVTSNYRRLGDGEAEAESFAAAALGDYLSADANATASIRLGEEGLSLMVRDGLGRVETKLRPRGARVGATSPASPMEIAYWTVALAPGEGPSPGFTLSSMRTRHLEFRRAPPLT